MRRSARNGPARPLALAGLLARVAATAIVSAIFAIGARAVLARFHLPAYVGVSVIVLAALPVIVVLGGGIYEVLTVPPLPPGLPAVNGGAPSAAHVDPAALLEFETRVVAASRPAAWGWAAVHVVSTLIVLALIAAALRYASRQPGMPMPYLYIMAAMFTLVAIGSTASKLYRTWAAVSVPLDRREAVVVKPVERILLLTHLGFIAGMVAFFTLTRSPAIIGLMMVFGGVVAAFRIQSYRQTVTKVPVNPIDIAPMTVGANEPVTISIAGITLGVRGVRGKAGFHRWTPQQSYVPASGRRLDPWAQNAMLVSDAHIFFIFVPIGRGDQEMVGTASFESLYAGNYIRAKLDEMLRTMRLEEIYRSHPINFAIALADVAHVDVEHGAQQWCTITFVDGDGGTLSAIAGNSPDVARFEAFASHVGAGS